MRLQVLHLRMKKPWQYIAIYSYIYLTIAIVFYAQNLFEQQLSHVDVEENLRQTCFEKSLGHTRPASLGRTRPAPAFMLLAIVNLLS